MTVAELHTILLTNNGQLTEQEALDFRNSYFAEDITEVYSNSLWVLSNDIDYAVIQPVFWYTLKKAILDWLFSDDEQSDIDNEYDVCTKQDGDKVERNVRQNTDLSTEQKNEIYYDIGQFAFRIDSTKLQTEVTNSTPY